MEVMSRASRTIWPTTLMLVFVTGCWVPRAADVTSWAREGRVERLTEVVGDQRAAPEVRAQAASALFMLGRDREVEAPLTELPADERSPIVAYLLHSFLPDLLAQDPERGRTAMLTIRPFGSADSVARSDRLILLSVMAALRQTVPSDPRYPRLMSRLEIAAPSHPRLLLTLLEEPRAPAETILRLVSPHPDLLATARLALARQVTDQSPPDPGLLRALARWGPVDPVIAELSRGGQRAVAAAQALAVAPPQPKLATVALEVAEDSRASPMLRTAMLDVLARMRPLDVRARLLRLIRGDPHLEVRLQAFRAVATLEGTAAVLAALESFPRRIDLSRTEVLTHLVPGLTNAGPEEARRLARRALRSPSPLARQAGILVLQEVGKQEDAARLTALARRRGPWATEASRVAHLLSEAPTGASVAHR